MSNLAQISFMFSWEAELQLEQQPGRLERLAHTWDLWQQAEI